MQAVCSHSFVREGHGLTGWSWAVTHWYHRPSVAKLEPFQWNTTV